MWRPQSIPVTYPICGCSIYLFIVALYDLRSLILTGSCELPRAKCTDFERAYEEVESFVALVGFNI